MTSTAEHLYAKLPSVYRMRDATVGYPLRSLIEAWAEQVDRLERDIGALYRNLFIETCEEWAVPYVAQLIDATILPSISDSTLTARAQVANTLRLRRRKGTLAMIEETASNAAEWTAHANEYFQRLQTTPFINHLTPRRQQSVDMRSPLLAERLNTPFDPSDRTIEVRRISSGRGRFNLKNIGIHLWRLRADRLVEVEAQSMPNLPGRFHLHPLLLDFPLFHYPHTEEATDHISEPIHVPEPLIRWAVFHDLRQYKEASLAGNDAASDYFQPTGQTPAIEISINGESVPPEHIRIADLGDWNWRPPTEEAVADSSGETSPVPIRIAIDPERGRLSLPSRRRARSVRVTFASGSLTDAGGGSYDRTEAIDAWLDGNTLDWQIGVSKVTPPVANSIVGTVEEALAAWSAQPSGTVGAIFLLENSAWSPPDASGWTVSVPEGSRLLVASSTWPEDFDRLGVSLGRRTGNFRAREVRGVLLAETGNPLFSIEGTADIAQQGPGELMLNGLFLGGAITGTADSLGKLTLSDVTADPSAGLDLVGTEAVAHPEFLLTVERSFLGPVTSSLRDLQLSLRESLFNGTGRPAVAAPGASLDIGSCTFLGGVHCAVIYATDSVFRDPLIAARRQVGCVRFSYLPFNQQTPRRYRCQPELAHREAETAVAKQHALVRVRPVFESVDMASPWYGVLSARCPREIAQGNEHANEMGVYGPLVQHLREKALALALDDALPVSLESGRFYQT